MQVNRHFTSPNFPPRAVSDLPSNVTCNLYGWDQHTAAPRHEDVFIYRAEFCDPNSPQISCSTFQSLQDEICSARLGSPVFCEANFRFSGFMTSDGCISDGTRVLVNYQSTNTFRLWFDEVLRADSNDRHESSQFIVNVMEFNPRVGASERFRCVGTLITQHHVLTMASCVQATSNFQFVIGVQANWQNIGRSVVEPEAISIHPNFEAAQMFTANVAVIRVRQTCLIIGQLLITNFFQNGLRVMHRNLMIPRTLGSLPTNNATDGNLCQVVGWGNTPESSRQDVVAVYRPQLCQGNLPQVFCSIIDTESSETETALQGSPVVCGDGSAVAGFVLGTRVLVGNLNALDFHSVGDFRGWIENVSGADKLATLSMLAFLSAILISVKIL